MSRVLAPALPLGLLYGLTWLLLAGAPLDLHALFSLALSVPLIWLTIADLRRFEIPDAASLFLAGIAGLDLSLTQPSALVPHLVSAIAVTAVFWISGAIYFRRRGIEGLGIGDAKLFGAATLLLGPEKLPELILLSSLGGILGYGLAKIRGRTEAAPGVPFGPFIAYAAYLLAFLDPVFV